MLSGEVRLADGRVVPLLFEDCGLVNGNWTARISLDGAVVTSAIAPDASASGREAVDRSTLRSKGVTDEAFDAWLRPHLAWFRDPENCRGRRQGRRRT